MYNSYGIAISHFNNAVVEEFVKSFEPRHEKTGFCKCENKDA